MKLQCQLRTASILAGAALALSCQAARPWKDTQGNQIDPFAKTGGKIQVLFFAMTDCPLANSYAPQITRIEAKYHPRGVAFSIVYVDSDITPASATKHAKEYGYHFKAILDPLHTLAKQAGATVSPEAVIVGPQGSILYRGRIDDRIVSYSQERPAPTRQDLCLALDAILKRTPFPSTASACIGCYISPPAK